MAHPAQQRFCQEVKGTFPRFFKGTRVLEIGSRNINGSVRTLFEDTTYVGLDVEGGPCVDVVSLGHEYEDKLGSFDVVCSTEAFEHDPHAEKTIANMLRLLKPSGLFFMTCAGIGRGEHGTAKTGRCYGPDPTFYRNVSQSVFLNWLDVSQLRELYLRHNPGVGDLYAYAIKA